ncbi:MAG: IS1595 family transposase [Alphaproteobacteria bacterium]|nr:IS1595 family transposase [Alphaproteobacteria bacterium]
MPAELPARFRNEEAARKHLESIQWPDGPACPHCGVVNEASRIKGGRKGLMFCNACRMQFSVTVGTVFERSHVPLHTWLYATHLLCSSKKGISSHQLSRMLGVSYKTAWFMSHRIRAAMAPAAGAPPIGGEGKIIEADETYIGTRSGVRKHPGSGGPGHKIAILSLVERGGKMRSFKLGGTPKGYEIKGLIQDYVDPKSTLHTDGAQMYKASAVAKHESVDHSAGEYARGDVHTNTVEGVFSIFKRGMVGTYQHCGEQHLQRYLAEFDFRYSNRVKLGINDAMRADKALEGIKGKRLTYRPTN